MGICADLGLTVFGGDATDAYTRYPAPNNTYLAVDDAYAEWYKDKHAIEISKIYVLPMYHALQGQPKSEKNMDEINWQHCHQTSRIFFNHSQYMHL